MHPTHATAASPRANTRESLLTTGRLPIEELAELAAREGKRPRPIYGAHKWFARRAGSSFRALLVATQIDDEDQFWPAYYGEADLSGVTVLDPFVGGGTSVVEASRLGATAIGADIDSIACAVTGFEMASVSQNDPTAVGDRLRDVVAPRLASYYETEMPDGEVRDVLHFFWVQEFSCGDCGGVTHAHPHFRLAFESAGSRQWAFCRACGEVHDLPRWFKSFTCDSCGDRTEIASGPESRGVVTCDHCGSSERLIDHAKRTESPPAWHLFAIESISKDRPGAGRVNMTGRRFSPATDDDRKRYVAASEKLRALSSSPLEDLEDSISTSGRSDDRLLKYGYASYRELFNERQRLHLSILLDEIERLPKEERRAASISFSDHLTKNCMLTCYAFGWRRLVPLFAFRAYRHVTRPVELNPWLVGVGRGTYPNAVKQSARAVNAAKHPTELLRDGGEIRVPARIGGDPTIVNAAAQDLPLADSSVDVVMTDPPYFDNIDYSELADFYRPWMKHLGLIGRGTIEASKSLASKGRGASSAESFAAQLTDVSTELGRVLKPNGLVAFTFRHNTATGWSALSEGLREAGNLRCVQVFPILAEGANALHTKEQSGVFDAVFVFRRGTVGGIAPSDRAMRLASAHSASWSDRLEAAELPIAFREQDRLNFSRACEVAALLGAFD